MSGLRNLACGAALALIAVFAIAPHAGYTISSTPVMVVNPVTVGNPDDPAAFAKAQGIQHPFHIVAGCAIKNLFFCVGVTDFSALFPNQRIIIEYYNVTCSFSTGLSLRLVEFSDESNSVPYNAPILDHTGGFDGFGGTTVVISQPVRIYLDAGTRLTLFAAAAGTTANSLNLNCEYIFSGQAISP